MYRLVGEESRPASLKSWSAGLCCEDACDVFFSIFFLSELLPPWKSVAQRFPERGRKKTE